jgi:hypothetical protein
VDETGDSETRPTIIGNSVGVALNGSSLVAVSLVADLRSAARDVKGQISGVKYQE